ncbi:MAG: transposase [Thermoplasmata archaeon]|nr:transposase [Thermoplasmata archaeon]
MPKLKKDSKPKKQNKKKLSDIELIKLQMEKGLMTEPILSEPETAMCRNLVVQFYEIQEIRKGMNSAKDNIERDYEEKYPNFDTKPQESIIKLVENLEAKIKDELGLHISKLRIYAWLNLIEGIGPIISAGLISGLQDPAKFTNPSKMNRFCGLAPVDWCKKCDHRYIDPKFKESWAKAEATKIEERKKKSGKNIKKKTADIMKLLCNCDHPAIIQVAEKKVKGLPIHYVPFMKTLLTYKTGYLGFIMHKGYYRNWYDKFRAEEDRKHPDLSDGHRLARARRKTAKLFIQHFWNAWRRANGLSIVTPYVLKTGGHNYIPPPHEDVIQYLEDDWNKRHKKKAST